MKHGDNIAGRLCWLGLTPSCILAIGFATCTQVPSDGGRQAAASTQPPDTASGPAQPKTRGLKPAAVPREEPDVGVGGLRYEALARSQ